MLRSHTHPTHIFLLICFQSIASNFCYYFLLLLQGLDYSELSWDRLILWSVALCCPQNLAHGSYLGVILPSN